jgi:putative exosortase-associated protein (TIGR04073 family)
MRGFGKALGPLALALALACPAGAAAEEESYGKRFLAKLQHGVGNVAMGWQEVGKNAVNIGSQHGFVCGMTWGVARGAVHAVGRTLFGVAQFVSSPIPTEAEYITPPYIWDRPSEDTRYFGIHLPGPWTRFGPLDDGGMHR